MLWWDVLFVFFLILNKDRLYISCLVCKNFFFNEDMFCYCIIVMNSLVNRVELCFMI